MEERDAIEQTLLQRDNLVKVGLPVPALAFMHGAGLWPAVP
jgi:hypothetical protein